MSSIVQIPHTSRYVSVLVNGYMYFVIVDTAWFCGFWHSMTCGSFLNGQKLVHIKGQRLKEMKQQPDYKWNWISCITYSRHYPGRPSKANILVLQPVYNYITVRVRDFRVKMLSTTLLYLAWIRKLGYNSFWAGGLFFLNSSFSTMSQAYIIRTVLV